MPRQNMYVSWLEKIFVEDGPWVQIKRGGKYLRSTDTFTLCVSKERVISFAEMCKDIQQINFASEDWRAEWWDTQIRECVSTEYKKFNLYGIPVPLERLLADVFCESKRWREIQKYIFNVLWEPDIQRKQDWLYNFKKNMFLKYADKKEALVAKFLHMYSVPEVDTSGSPIWDDSQTLYKEEFYCHKDRVLNILQRG